MFFGLLILTIAIDWNYCGYNTTISSQPWPVVFLLSALIPRSRTAEGIDTGLLRCPPETLLYEKLMDQ